MTTRNEALERARAIWSSTTIAVVGLSEIAGGGGWLVTMDDGTVHLLDAHGHPHCHQSCDTIADAMEAA